MVRVNWNKNGVQRVILAIRYVEDGIGIPIIGGEAGENTVQQVANSRNPASDTVQVVTI